MGGRVWNASLSFSLSSHLHLGNATIHNSSAVQFGRFPEYVIAPSYTASVTFPRRFCSLAPLCLPLFRPVPRGRDRPSSQRDDASCRQCIIDITSRRCRPDLNNSPIDRSIDRYRDARWLLPPKIVRANIKRAERRRIIYYAYYGCHRA